MIIIPILFVCLAFFISFCSRQKITHDYQKHVMDKNKNSIYLFELMANKFTDKEIDELIEMMKK